MPRFTPVFVRRILIGTGLSLLALSPGTALGAAPADGARIGTSDHNATNHAIIAWPEGTGNLSLNVEAVESPTDPAWVMTFTSANETSPGTISAPCTLTTSGGPDYIECPVATNADLQNGIEIWTGDGVDYVAVATGGSTAPAAIFLRDGNGTQQAVGGDGNDYFNTAAGDDTATGANYLRGGDGVDQYAPSTNAYDVVDYLDSARGTTNPVSITFDCVANDGNAAFDGGLENAGCTSQGMNGMQGTDGNDTLTADGGSSVLYGKGGNDVMDGGDATDQLIGGTGDDTITGGGGHDQVDGDNASGLGTGNDTILLRDGHYDELFSCGGGTDSAQLDESATDVVTASDCETLDRGAFTPGGGTGGGGTGGGGTGAGDSLAGVLDPTKNLTIPDFRPYKKGRKFRFTSIDKAKKQLDDSGINLDLRMRRVALSLVKSELRKDAEDGDVVAQPLAPGSTISSTLSKPYPHFQLSVYEEALDYKGKRCPYGDSKKYKPMLNAITDGPLGYAMSYLKKRGCKVVIVKEVVVKNAVNSTVSGAGIRNRKSSKGRELAVALVVDRPPRQDFRINLTERPAAELKAHPSFAKEIGIGTDGKLTAGLAPAVLHLDLYEALTGRAVRSLEVQIVRSDGVVLASTKTGDTGGLTFTVPVDFTGELDIRVYLEPVNAGGLEALEAWHSIDVVDRKRKPFYTKSGRYFKWSNAKNRYLPAASPPTVSQVHAQIADRMRQLVDGLVGKNPAFATASSILANTAATPQQRLQDVADGVGLLPGALLSGQKPDGKITGASIVDAPAVKLVSGGFLPSTMPVALLPKAGDVDTASLIGLDGATLIGLDGATLIGLDGGSLIGLDGATLIGLDGATLTSVAGSSLIGLDGATLQSGMKLISDKGAGLGGSGFVPVSR